jgi:hypothetical protein
MVAAGLPGTAGKASLTDRELVEVLDDEAQVLKPHSVDALVE